MIVSLVFYIFPLFAFRNFIVTNGAEHFHDTLQQKYGRIVFSSVLFRHGDRNPEGVYPNDVYDESLWLEGFGQLTRRGKSEEYNLGEWLRSRYDNFTSQTYNLFHKQILMSSSDYDRTLMSAELVLAGFIPPKSEIDTWNPDLKWQPIAVHTIPITMDNTISMHKPCERYDLERKSLDFNPTVRALWDLNHEIFDYVAEKSGITFPTTCIADAVKKLHDIYDILYIENLYNYTLPSWTKTVFPEPLRIISEQSFNHITYTPIIKRLKGGPFLKEIIREMDGKMDPNNDFSYKIHFYSGHDTTLSAILDTLSLYNDIGPPYAAALIFELRQKGNNYYVSISYRNTSSEPPYLLSIPSCGEVCEYGDFISFTKPYIPGNWEDECHVDFITRVNYLTPWQIIAIAMFLLIFTILFVYTMKIIFAAWGRKGYDDYEIIKSEWNSVFTREQ